MTASMPPPPVEDYGVHTEGCSRRGRGRGGGEVLSTLQLDRDGVGRSFRRGVPQQPD